MTFSVGARISGLLHRNTVPYSDKSLQQFSRLRRKVIPIAPVGETLPKNVGPDRRPPPELRKLFEKQILEPDAACPAG